jgi:hypothetical protein
MAKESAPNVPTWGLRLLWRFHHHGVAQWSAGAHGSAVTHLACGGWGPWEPGRAGGGAWDWRCVQPRRIFCWLVVWNMNFMTFHILGMSSSQLTFIFFRGVETTNQFVICLSKWEKLMGNLANTTIVFYFERKTRWKINTVLLSGRLDTNSGG